MDGASYNKYRTLNLSNRFRMLEKVMVLEQVTLNDDNKVKTDCFLTKLNG